MDLQQLAEIQETEISSWNPVHVRCCTAAGCLSANGQAVSDSLKEAVQQNNLEGKVTVRNVGCLRLCGEGPLVQVVDTQSSDQPPMYQKVTPDNAASVVTGTQTDRLDKVVPNHPFFVKQADVVLENSGVVEPERIESYIATDGYQALGHVLEGMSPQQVIDTITQSGLRGRGGAGYPTGVKWATVAKNEAPDKYVVCNADEGDPGAFMNRSVLESDPHRVLEGMAIAGYAVGAKQGYIYVRGEYPLAIDRLQKAIKQATKLGLLGTHIFSSTFDFRIDIRIGAGAFVCGEETALMASIMGERGNPKPRPPYPAEVGLWGAPTLLNNVETLANVPTIIRKGAEWFASIGTEKSKGTKVFCVTGKVKNTGLVEVPLGTPLKTIVEEIGGGVPNGKIKAVQTGGPSGGCIPAEHLDVPVDYESLQTLGSIMGSGGMIIMDEDNSMVDVARFYMSFCMDESCGKCIPCRAGTVQLHNLLSKILEGKGTSADLQVLEDLCEMVQATSLCGLGQSAPNPVISTLHYFRDEYLAQLREPVQGG